MINKAPIGVFDSGYGGLTVLSELRKAMPDNDFIYLGDNARAPYGTRSFDVVYEYTLQAVKTLFDQGCHLVVLACNTASAKALRTIQINDLQEIDSSKRVLGVIRPCAEMIDQFSTTKHIGVLGTNGTVNSESYILEIKKLHPHIIVTQEACPIWVPLVEDNTFNTPGGELFIEQNLASILAKDPRIDTLILGCTHYPILMEQIRKFVPDAVNIIAQGEVVADKLVDYLKRHPEMADNCSKNGEVVYYTTENPRSFEEKASLFLDEEILAEQIHLS
jgi:glutamate racemase